MTARSAGRQVRLDRQDVGMRIVGDLEQQRADAVAALEGLLTGRQLIERHGKREQVGAAVHLLAGDLLGAHIGGRPHHGAGRRL